MGGSHGAVKVLASTLIQLFSPPARRPKSVPLQCAGHLLSVGKGDGELSFCMFKQPLTFQPALLGQHLRRHRQRPFDLFED